MRFLPALTPVRGAVTAVTGITLACARFSWENRRTFSHTYAATFCVFGKEGRTMRNLLSAVLILSLAASPLAAQTKEWTKYKNTNGNFTVLFPGEPGDSVNKTVEGAQSHTLLAKEGSAIYTVVYTVMTSAQTVDEATFQGFKNGVFKELPKCETGAEQQASPAMEGYIGRSYRLSCDMPNTRVMIVGNLYWGKHYAFAVMTMFPASVSEPTSTEKQFADSFAVIDLAR